MHPQIDILGPVQVRLGTDICVPTGPKLQSILTLLAIRVGDVMQRDELIEELALNATTMDTNNALHAHVRRLRQWFHAHGVSPAVIQTAGRSGYRLDLQRDDIDAYAFIEQANRAASLHRQKPHAAVDILEDALRMWRGIPAQTVSDDIRAQSLIRELDAHKQFAQETLLACYIKLNMHQRAVISADKFTLESPYNEKIWACHIMALRLMGKQAEAARVYRQVQKLLCEDLGVAPSGSLRTALTDDRWTTV